MESKCFIFATFLVNADEGERVRALLSNGAIMQARYVLLTVLVATFKKR